MELYVHTVPIGPGVLLHQAKNYRPYMMLQYVGTKCASCYETEYQAHLKPLLQEAMVDGFYADNNVLV